MKFHRLNKWISTNDGAIEQSAQGRMNGNPLSPLRPHDESLLYDKDDASVNEKCPLSFLKNRRSVLKISHPILRVPFLDRIGQVSFRTRRHYSINCRLSRQKTKLTYSKHFFSATDCCSLVFFLSFWWDSLRWITQGINVQCASFIRAVDLTDCFTTNGWKRFHAELVRDFPECSLNAW